MTLLKILVTIAGYVITISCSGKIVKLFIGPSPEKNIDSSNKLKFDLGAIIGKCENLLTITFILANELTGLALIFAAKSIFRAEESKKDPRYYLGGTLVNFCFSVLMGFLIKLILNSL